jgi:predicted peptidase
VFGVQLPWIGAALIGAVPAARPEAAAQMGHQPATLSPGVETEVTIPGGLGAMRVYLPTNYTPSRKWPVIFLYPGTNGDPTTSPIRAHANGRDWILVGMPYVESSPAVHSLEEQNAYVQREVENFRKARSCIAGQAAVDAQRVYLGGISKGGWTTSMLANREMAGLAGLVILLAGRQRTGADPLDRAAVRNKPIYIGVGANEPNRLPALQARTVYESLGAVVTYEEYPRRQERPDRFSHRRNPAAEKTPPRISAAVGLAVSAAPFG